MTGLWHQPNSLGVAALVTVIICGFLASCSPPRADRVDSLLNGDRKLILISEQYQKSVRNPYRILYIKKLPVSSNKDWDGSEKISIRECKDVDIGWDSNNAIFIAYSSINISFQSSIIMSNGKIIKVIVCDTTKDTDCSARVNLSQYKLPHIKSCMPDRSLP